MVTRLPAHLFAVLILLTQVVGALLPGGAVVCINPIACDRGGIPVRIETEEPGCSCCGGCPTEDLIDEEPASSDLVGFSTPCTCCIGVPVMPAMIRLNVGSASAELEGVLSRLADVPAVLGHAAGDAWWSEGAMSMAVRLPLGGRAPDWPTAARAVGVGTTRLVI